MCGEWGTTIGSPSRSPHHQSWLKGVPEKHRFVRRMPTPSMHQQRHRDEAREAERIVMGLCEPGTCEHPRCESIYLGGLGLRTQDKDEAV